MEQIHASIEFAAEVLELIGVAVILIAIALASYWFLRDGIRGGWRRSYDDYRANLGRGILLGLELLVGADIIGTITAPLTWNSVGLLGAIIVLRTFLSFSLETEIEGRWPWQQRDTSRQKGDGLEGNAAGKD